MLFLSLFPVNAFAIFVPHQGDYFNYYEVIDVGNGIGDYAGYTDHTVVIGTEDIKGVTADGIASAHYSNTWNYSSNDGSRDSGGASGDFTFSSNTFFYVNGTDDQTGYVNPTVWFCMDNSIPEGGTFYLLNTAMTVRSREYSYYLPSENRNVYAIYAQGVSSYQRDDAYGQFIATYTWDAYFDPTSGYIIGYDYTEHNTNSSGTGFTYTEKLYVTSTSFQLATAPTTNPPTTLPVTPTITAIVTPTVISNLVTYAIPLAIVALIIILLIGLYVTSRNSRRLPKHPSQRPVYTPPIEQPPPPPPPDIDLTPKQTPMQQIVIKEVVKVNCRYCGALIDSTVEKCPFCGAPRR